MNAIKTSKILGSDIVLIYHHDSRIGAKILIPFKKGKRYSRTGAKILIPSKREKGILEKDILELKVKY